MAIILNDRLKNKTLLKTSGLVAGEWLDDQEKKVFHVYDPASGQVLCDCADLGQQHFLDAIESAAVGTDEFSELTAKTRAGILYQWFALVMENADDCNVAFV